MSEETRIQAIVATCHKNGIVLAKQLRQALSPARRARRRTGKMPDSTFKWP
jgi:hypothetical protein